MLKKYDQKISLVINLKVDNSILVKRISGRVSCSICKKPFNEFFDPPKILLNVQIKIAKIEI